RGAPRPRPPGHRRHPHCPPQPDTTQITPAPGTARPPRRARAVTPAHPATKGHPMTLTDPVSLDLKRHLRTLKLGQLLSVLPERSPLARQNNLPHADFLEATARLLLHRFP